MANVDFSSLAPEGAERLPGDAPPGSVSTMQTDPDPDPSRYFPRDRESPWSRVSTRLAGVFEGSNSVWVAAS